MSLNADNARVAVTGAVYRAPSGTAAPTSADSSLDVLFADLGYVNEEGVTESRERATNDIIAWQNADTIRTVVTSATMTFACTLVETKEEVVELYYGSAVDGVDGSVSIVPAETGGRQAFVIDAIDDSDRIRTYIPSGEVTEVGEQVYVNGDAVGYPVTITAYPSGGYSAKKFYSALVDESSSSSSSSSS